MKGSLLQLRVGFLEELAHLTGTLRMFLLVNGEGRYADLTFFIFRKHTKSEQTPIPPSHLALLLEMLTHREESSPRNPRNPPEKTLGGRVRWSLGMHSEESVTYLQAELGEPSLSQPLPPGQSVPPTTLFCSLLYSNAPHLLAPPLRPLIDRHSTSVLLIGQILNLCSGRPNPTPTWPPSPCCSPRAASIEVISSWWVIKQMSVGMWVKLQGLERSQGTGSIIRSFSFVTIIQEFVEWIWTDKSP